ncbi:hypothetical protein NM208_g12327 [Fusarium decemcellulare]|uniref:Uncharacterized protein n=1 Tax=Fusarium decemcellulare TaxID=57161 RepID=A0ACC1RSM7_9HYPO|nr:hypothetical protein NM208_g12327 [Fusarium decemcellulare]
MDESQVPSSCLLDSGDLACPWGNWEVINQALLSYWPQAVSMATLPGEILLSGRFSQREFGSRLRKTLMGEPLLWDYPVTLASAPLAPIADAVAELGRLWSFAARTDETSRLNRKDMPIYTFGTFPIIGTIAKANSTLVLMNTLPSTDLSNSIWDIIKEKSERSSTSPSVTWIDEPSLMQKLNASIAAIVFVPREESSEAYCCTNLAAWMVSGIMRAAGLWNETTPSSPAFSEVIIEHLIAASLTNGLARTSYHSQLRLDLLKEPKDPADLWQGGTWRRQFLLSSPFETKGRKRGHHAFNEPQRPERNTKLNFRAYVDGMAYSSDGSSVKAMIAVLCAYMLVVLAHFTTCLWTGWVSADWGSSPEVAVLVMTAEPSKEFDQTGAGIETLKPYESKVRVKEVDGNLKMFISDGRERSVGEDGAGYVRPNEAYG